MATSKEKPKKPYKDFPLWPASNGQWAKSIRGKRFHFGIWADPDAALARYVKVRDDLYAGRQPAAICDGDNLKFAANLFLAEKELEVDRGEIKLTTWREYRAVCKIILEILNPQLDLSKMTARDVKQLRDGLADRYRTPKTLCNQIVRARVFLRWLNSSDLLASPIDLKFSFRQPSSGSLRIHRSKQPRRIVESNVILKIIKKSTGYVTPAVWLGINCGLGNRDVHQLKWSHIQGEWLDFPRPKNGIQRKAWLWPESLAALKTWRQVSPESQFVCCGTDGQQLGGGETEFTPITTLFSDLLKDAGAYQRGIGFYSLRHTYRTIADATRDWPAILTTMGHADHSISGVYREYVTDDRLKEVSQYVRKQVVLAARVGAPRRPE